MKDLVYYTVGGSPEYVHILAASIDSLREFGGNRKNYDILVMCDEHFREHLASLDIDHIHMTPVNATPVHASMRKTEIFRFSGIERYSRVLFLDCDIVIGKSLENVFESIERSDVLYVKPENKDPESHKNMYYSRQDLPYSDAELKGLARDQVYAFNAGQFAFRVSPVMRENFEAVARGTENYDERIHFYEQSFMNAYFNRARAVDYSLDPHIRLFAQIHMTAPPKAINHFCGATASIGEKLDWMERYYEFIKGRLQVYKYTPHIRWRYTYILWIIISCILTLYVGLTIMRR